MTLSVQIFPSLVAFLSSCCQLETHPVYLIEVAGAGWIERPPSIRRSASLGDQTLPPLPLITDEIKQS